MLYLLRVAVPANEHMARALYGDVVPAGGHAGGPPSMTVTFFFESASVAATSTT